jgi:hypothetical protein
MPKTNKTLGETQKGSNLDDKGYIDFKVALARKAKTMKEYAISIGTTPRRLALAIHRWREKPGLPRGKYTCEVLNAIYQDYGIRIAQDYPPQT